MSLTTPYSDSFQVADGVTTKFFFDKKFEPISKNYVKCEVYNADGSVIVPDFEPVLEEGAIKIVALTQPDGTVLNAPREGSIVRIYRDVPEMQNATVSALQASTAQQIVQNFDNIVAMVQELQYANEHFTLRSTLPQRDLQIDLLRDIDDQKLVYWDNEKRKLVVTNYRQDELLLPADKEDILAQANAYSDEQNAVLESKINGKLTAIDSQIDANADAIQKTREDFASADQAIRDDMNAEDSRLQTQITAQAAAITTNKNDIDELGDQVSEIESKIPESASTTNPLITESDLQKIDLENYVKKSGDEMSGELVVAPENPNASTRQITFVGQMGVDGRIVPAELKLGNGPTFEGDFYVEGNPNGGFVITNSKIVLSPSPQYTGITRRLGEKDYKFDITYTKTLNNGEEIQVPTVGGTMARIEDLAELRADVNLTDSELQTQITAQAAAIATLDSEKLDKNQGNINAGKYLIVGNDGNIELTTSGGGGGGGIGSVNHDETLKGSGTDEFPLGLADAIKDEIADKAPKETVEALTQAINGIIGDYVKKSGDSMTGGLTLPELTVRTAEGEFYVSVVAGVVTIATNNGLDFASHVKFDHAPTTDDNTTYADALDTSLVRKAQVATAISDAMANVDALPSQSGNEGKVLSTNGSEAEWTEMPSLIIRRL